MTTLGTRPGRTRFTLHSVFATTALGAVLVAFACGDNGTTNTPNPNPDMTWPGDADLATVVVPSAPTLTTVSPKLASTAGDTSVTLTGTGFKSGATVKLGTVTVPANDVQVSTDGTTITIKAPARLGMAGKVDILVTNPDNLSVSSVGGLTYFLGQPTVGAARAIVAERGPRCIMVAAMKKGTTTLDLVTANFNANSVSVFPGDGVGGFGTRVDRGTGTGPYTVAVGDINNDGSLDVISANQGGGGSLSIMTGDGLGGLNAPIAHTMYVDSSSLPQSVVIADINNDKKPDLVVSRFAKVADNVALLIGNNTTNFTNMGSQTLSVNGGNLYNLIAADFDNDGNMDVVGVHQTTAAANVSPMRNLGNAAAPFFTVGSNQSLGSSPTAVTVGDFDNDGYKDLAVVNQLGNSVSILKGSKTGTFTDTPANRVTTVGMGPEHLAALDFNLDGNLDLVVANLTSGNVSLLLGKGDGTFAAMMSLNAGSGVAPNWVAVGDFNKDGRPDIAVTDYNTTALVGRIMIMLNTSQ